MSSFEKLRRVRVCADPAHNVRGRATISTRPVCVVLTTLALCLSGWQAGAQTLPRITSANVSGTTVTIQGTNFGTAAATVLFEDVNLFNVFVNPTGDMITGELPTAPSPGTFLLTVLTTATQATQPCTTVQPGPSWVCIGSGWVPADHPLATGRAPHEQGATFVVTVGATGLSGAAGSQGPQGPVGPAGPQGATGPLGAAGPLGATGAPGATGPQGTPGMMGPMGMMGMMGPMGFMGPMGMMGPMGPQGIQGPAGPAGPAGPTGLTGPQGLAAPSTTVVDSLGSLLGRLIYADQGSVRVLTSAGYLIDIGWDGSYAPAQIWYEGGGCTGIAYLNSGTTAPTKMFGKSLVYSGSLVSLMRPKNVSNGVSVSGGPYPVASVDNAPCDVASIGQGWELIPIASGVAGLPLSIVGPLVIQ